MNKIQFEYFQGMEAEQYSFYRVPKTLFTEEYFKLLSCEAKVLYGLMLDRMSLSLKNRWFDDENRVYIIFTIEEIMELMCCKTQKAVKLMKELDTENGIGLIEKKRLGFGRPNVIYVKNFKIKRNMVKKEMDEWSDNREIQQKDSEELEVEHCQYEFGLQSEEEKTGQNEGKESLGKQNFVALDSFENQNSRILKIKNQEYTKMDVSGNISRNTTESETVFPEISLQIPQNFENQNSRVLKIENQEFPKSKFKNSENQNSEVLKIKNQEIRFSKSNNTEFINTDNSKIDLIHLHSLYPQSTARSNSVDMMEKIEKYREIIRKNISYECFLDNPYYAREEVDELVELMSDVMLLPDKGVLRIGGIEKPVSVVKSRFMQIRYSHMEYVMFCLQRSNSKVENIRAYLLTTLYNATMTIENFYRSEVHHDQCRNG